MLTYEGICEKLGFDALTYRGETADTETDEEYNPFEVLTVEELDFLMNYMRKRMSKN